MTDVLALLEKKYKLLHRQNVQEVGWNRACLVKRSYKKAQIETLEIKSLMSEKKNTLNEINCRLDILEKDQWYWRHSIINYQT